MTRTGLIRIIRLTRTRFSRSLVDSGRASMENETGTLSQDRVPVMPSPDGRTPSVERAGTRSRSGTGPAG